MREYFACPDPAALDAASASVMVTAIICFTVIVAPFAWGWFFGRA